jgi:Mce-associated membrane protein
VTAGTFATRAELTIRHRAAVDEHRKVVLAAARQEAVNFTTLDYRTIQADLDRVSAGATGDFRTQFLAQTPQLKSLLTENKATSDGQVLQAGLVSDNGSRARALLAVDARVTNSSAPSGAVRHYRLQLDLQLVGGQWRTSQLQFVG